MDDPDTTRQNGGSGVEGRDSGPGKRSVRGGIAGRKDYARDKLTNGSKTLPDTDGRLRIARRFRDIAAAILVDQGGAELCSESRRQLIRRFSAACVLAEDLEGRLARGEEIDVERHALLCSTMTRLAQRSASIGGPRTSRRACRNTSRRKRRLNETAHFAPPISAGSKPARHRDRGRQLEVMADAAHRRNGRSRSTTTSARSSPH